MLVDAGGVAPEFFEVEVWDRNMNSSRAGINSAGSSSCVAYSPACSGSGENAVRRQHLNDLADTTEVQDLLRVRSADCALRTIKSGGLITDELAPRGSMSH